MNQQRLVFEVARHRDFISRATRMLAAAETGRALPEGAEFSDDELKGLDNGTFDLVMDILGERPSRDIWRSPMASAFSDHEWNDKDQFWFLRAYKRSLQRSLHLLDTFAQQKIGDTHVGDKVYNVHSAGVFLSDNVHAGDIQVSNSANTNYQTQADLDRLAEQLRAVRKALQQDRDVDNPECDIAIGEIAQAEKAAQSGDTGPIAGHLKKVGKWTLDIATKIGADIAAAAIKSSLGL